MNWLTAIFMVLFPLLGVIYLIMDKIFYDKVKSNSNNVLTYEDAKIIRPLFWHFLSSESWLHWSTSNYSSQQPFAKETSRAKIAKSPFLYSCHPLWHGLKMCLKLSFALLWPSKSKRFWARKFSLQKRSLPLQSQFCIWPISDWRKVRREAIGCFIRRSSGTDCYSSVVLFCWGV